MSMDIKVEIDVTNKPTNPTRAFTDITMYDGISRIRSAQWSRDGRTRETERTQPGNASLIIDNRDGFLDRNNPDGPFYGALSTSYWMRISLIVDDVTYPRFTGIKLHALGNRPAGTRDRFVQIDLDSALAPLQLFPLGGQTFDEQAPGDRVTSVLAAANVAAGTIDAGKTTLMFPAVAYDETDATDAFSHLQQVEQDERGLLFSQPDGTIDFQDRYYRPTVLSSAPTATIGESDGDIRYREGDPDDEADYLANFVAITPAGDSPVVQIWTDSDASDDNFLRRLDLSALTEDTDECLGNAQWYVSRFGYPAPYVKELEIVGARDPSTWATILAAANSDLFAGEFGDVTVALFLERVQESWQVGAPLQVFWDLSPAERDAVWRLGVAGLSEIGTTNRLG